MPFVAFCGNGDQQSFNQSAIKPQARNSGYYVHSINQLVMKGRSISNHFRLSYRYVQYWLSVIAKMNQQHWPITFLAFPKTSWSKSAMQTVQLRCCPFSRINHRINLPMATIPICIWGESAAGWTGTSSQIWISNARPRWCGGFLKWGVPIWIGFSIINYKPSSYWGTPIYGNSHIAIAIGCKNVRSHHRLELANSWCLWRQACHNLK